MRKRTLYWALSAGPLVTFSLGFGITSDINIFKLLVLGIISGFSLALIVREAGNDPTLLRSNTFIVGWIFILALLVPIFFSSSPKAQQFFGTYGRNLGFLHYLFLTLIFLGVSRVETKAFIPLFLKSIVVVGTIESFYGVTQFLGFDPLPWNNSDKWVIGTFGNPNYLSSFLALAITTNIYLSLLEKRPKYRILLWFVAMFQFSAMVLTASTQGLILLSLGCCALIVNQSFVNSIRSGLITLTISSIFATSGLFGIFQTGPLTRYLYQESVSFRGDYWRAGLNMFQSNWKQGVGLDSYGDFYRMYRDEIAAHRRGLDVFSNSAHNLLIDLAATGGIFLLVSYLGLLGLVLLKIYKEIKHTPKSNQDFNLLIVLWMMFNLQTLISINVPSLAIWGWIFSGLIIAYKSEVEPNMRFDKKQIKRLRNQQALANLLCCILTISSVFPLLNRDLKFLHALTNNDFQETARVVSRFPRDSDQIARLAESFQKVGRGKESLALAKLAVLENHNTSRAWKLIYTNEYSSFSDKARAKNALIKLDPYYAVNLN